jgi:hypothetical protein
MEESNNTKLRHKPTIIQHHWYFMGLLENFSSQPETCRIPKNDCLIIAVIFDFSSVVRCFFSTPGGMLGMEWLNLINKHLTTQTPTLVENLD